MPHDDRATHRLPGRARAPTRISPAATCFPELRARCPAPTFEDAFAAIKDGAAELGMIPIENSIAGPRRRHPPSPADLGPAHRRRALPADPLPADGASRARRWRRSSRVHSHVHALGQCRKIIRKLGLKPIVAGDTAGSAREVARVERPDPRLAAPPPRRRDLRPRHPGAGRRGRDAQHHPLRRPVERRRAGPPPAHGPIVTTFVFRVRNVPAALYKALGGFATNGVNMTKLESYMVDGEFSATQFYADVDGHPDDRPQAGARGARVLLQGSAHPRRLPGAPSPVESQLAAQ